MSYNSLSMLYRLISALRQRSNKAKGLILTIEEKAADGGLGVSAVLAGDVQRVMNSAYLYTIIGDYRTPLASVAGLATKVRKEAIQMAILKKRLLDNGEMGSLDNLPNDVRRYIGALAV